MEALAKGGRAGDRADLMLDALAALAVDTARAPRGARTDGAPFQVHVLECPKCRTAHLPTGRGDLAVDRTTLERARCDGKILEEGKRNRATIPPGVRRMVLARDRHRCRAPGCGHNRFLEVHHRVPRVKGGTNRPENLLTLCSACHRLAHEKPGVLAASGGG
jgi:5-methylcytosine-specific restriction endonuclease McrA